MNTKQRISVAAQREFGEHGFHGARVARIARRAGVNKQLLFYYFGSKAGLYRQVCKAAVERAASSGDTDAAAAASPPPPPDRLRRAVRHLHDTLAANPALVAALVDPGAPDTGDVVEARTAAASLLRGFTNAISDGQGLGYFRDDVDPGLAANQALALCAGHVALRLSTPKARWQESVTGLLLQAITW